MLRRLGLRLYADLQVRSGAKAYQNAVLVTTHNKPLPAWLPEAVNIDPGTCEWIYTSKDYERVLVYRAESSFSVFESAHACVTALKANNVQEADVHLGMNTGTWH